VFRTPVVRTLLGWLSSFGLWAFRWRTVVRLPDGPKYVIVLAPHTSYWDFPILVGAALKHGVECSWLATANLFRGPARWLFRWLGGIPVDRSRRNGLVDAVTEAFYEADRLAVAIAPEGSRHPRDRWKTGFYRIAVAAEVPFGLAFVDFATRTVGIDEPFSPTGDLEADLRRIEAFYAPKRGRHPDWYTPPLGRGEPG
jgi:1-acyl-sn-glycerol-3-phosphate acyltransferase